MQLGVTPAEIAEARADAEALMVDTYTAYEPQPGVRTVDPTNGMERQAYTNRGTTLGKTQARSREGDVQTRYVRIGGTDRPVVQGGLHIPISATVPTAGDYGAGWEYECTEISEISDPAELGSRYLVVEVPSKTHDTARRLDVVKLS